MDQFDIKDQAARFAGKIEAVAGTLTDDARAQMEGMASQATDTAEHVYSQVRDQVREAATAAASSVEKQPLAALMAVGLVCGILGFLLARR